MRLNLSTDYALRVLLYLGSLHGDEFVPASEIAALFDLSANHLSKITKDLTSRGWLEGRRGAGGGVRLAVSPAKLKIGRVVLALEDLELVECLQGEGNSCRLTSGCRLKSALKEASHAFVSTLDGYTLADLVKGKRLRRLLALED